MLTGYNAVIVPPNMITEDSAKITPEMLPLINLSQADIDSIIAQVPGGVANVQDIYGLTPLQTGMLYHHLMAKEGDPYLIVNQLRFDGRIPLKRYTDAMQQLIDRHDVLRTAIIWDGLNEPAQVVLRQASSLLSEIAVDESDMPVLEQLSEKFYPHHYRLDLTQAPLVRLMAAPTTERIWEAVQLMHHSIVDNSTLERLQEEIHSIMHGENEVFECLTPFRHFVAQTRLGKSAIEHTRFFSEMLGDIDEPTLPFNLSDVDPDKCTISEVLLNLSQELCDQLRSHARKLQVSLASIFHLAWAQVVAKASGREAVVFGTVLLGRLQAGEANNNIMGPMINMLSIRLDIDGRSVKTAVRDAHARLSALLAHEHAPLVLAQRCCGIPSGVPQFSAMLNYRHNAKMDEINMQLPGVSYLDNVGETTYPLTLSVDDNDTSICLIVQVVSSISASGICAYVQQTLESLVEALAHAPEQPIRELKVVPKKERTMLLHTWNQTTVKYPSVCCLHQLFEAQVELDGEAIAVKCEEQTLSYSELNVQANRLAHYLIAQGVKPDDRIALCVDRNLNSIIAILGILKSGGAYVPLDPAYPSHRLTVILQESDPMFLLWDTNGRTVLGSDHRISVIDLEQSLAAESSIDNPNSTELGLTSAHLSYVIYTSGSTGKPKGVMVEHRNATNVLLWVNQAFTAENFKHTSFSTSINFEMSVYECFAALSMGTTLHVVPNAIALNQESKISLLDTVPSAVSALLNTNMMPKSLQMLHLIGEPLKASLVKQVFKQTQVTELCPLYGLTETSLFSTAYRFKPEDEIFETIGRPIANTRIYLLDTMGEPAPLKAIGEIYIGGASVARGFLNRPELTAERFIPDPFYSDPAARMYRTGDLAQYRSDGNLVFLGRADQQVKIRGFRIELGEIESRLVEHPRVHEVVVKSCGSDVYLVAYVVADPNESLAQDLRAYLSSLLPDYMVPAAYVCLPSLPRTPNGKLDRRALPAPDDEAFARQQYAPPQGEIENKLADMWCKFFNIERVSRHDNFFELGGHSLLVMQFVSNAKSHNIHIDARGVFAFPILKNLAEQITNRSKRFYCDVAIPARQYGSEMPLFLLPDGAGDMSYAFELAHDIDKNIPIYVLPWTSPEKKQPSSIEDLAMAMITFIKEIQPNGPCALAGYSGGGILAYEITKQLLNIGYPVSFLGLIDTYSNIPTPFSETEMFLIYLRLEFPVFQTFDDLAWWDRIGKSSVNEAIEEIRKKNFDLSNLDIEWEAVLLKQRYNYQNMCVAYRIDALPIKVHLFRAQHFGFGLDDCKLDGHKKVFSYSHLGWEKYINPAEIHTTFIYGNHLTMMTNPKNRSLVGKNLTKFLLQKIPELK